jgi:hypothetical protein
MIGAEGYTSGSWPPFAAPRMDENRGPVSFNRNGPIPIRDEHQIIHRICAAQWLMAKTMRRAHHHIVVRVTHVIRPQIRRSNWLRPTGRSRHTVRAVQHPDDPVSAARRCAVALYLSVSQATTANRVRKSPPCKPYMRRHYDQIIWPQNPPRFVLNTQKTYNKWPDFAALVAR